MYLEEIHKELIWAGKLSESVDFDEFLSLFQDYENITILRKEMIEKGYDVLDPITFFKEVVNEIENLKETKFNNWDISEIEGVHFFIHTLFDSHKSYRQRIFIFNDNEDLELLENIDSPKDFYNLDKSYLEDLSMEFDENLILTFYNELTYPNIFNFYSTLSKDLSKKFDFKEANDLLNKGRNLLKSSDYSKLTDSIYKSKLQYNSYCNAKMSILNALVDNEFQQARSILESTYNSINTNLYNDLQELIDDKEYQFKRAMDLEDQAEIESKEEELEKVRREIRRAQKEYQHTLEMYRLEELEEQAQIKGIEREAINKDKQTALLKEKLELELQEQKRNNQEHENLRRKELYNSEQNNIKWLCRNCNRIITRSSAPSSTISVCSGREHVWIKIN